MKTTNGGGNITYNAVEPISNTIPSSYQLKQNYPNPFNPSTTIEFDIIKRDYVKIFIFDILGRNIETLADEQLSAGSYKVTWDAWKHPSGIYYCTLITEKYKETKKMALIK